MKAWASPLVMGTSAIRRVVTGRRVPASGISRNWSVQVGGLVVVEDGIGRVVEEGCCCLGGL